MASTTLPTDYLERVYAGVLGKIIGVLLGRPFEMWSHQRIMDELGPIKYYVHDKFNVPLVVIDDDISGTFTFVRALEEHWAEGKDCLTPEEVGKTWLNNVIERKCVFWWGGHGISTEHTAFQNLKKGIAAPASGSMKTNSKTIAEQIGAQIFIDGWALVAPGKPELAAQLADAAARVSHDGEAVNAAKLWAVMEAEAFLSKDVNHLLDTGLKYIPSESLIATLIADIRAWCKTDSDWRITRQRIEDEYGYHKYPGVCHVVPNHGIMIMALIYGGRSFHEAMHIINTCGWDTDCNSGNVGCLVAIMHGLTGFQGGPDWRGPVADRAIISSADGGYSINNAARIAFDIADMGRRLAGGEPLKKPKGGAQFHFSLTGSVQGFQATTPSDKVDAVTTEQVVDTPDGAALKISIKDLKTSDEPIEVLTDTFIPKDVLDHKRDYELVASPLLYPGQSVEAIVYAYSSPNAAIAARIRVKAYDSNDDLVTADSPPLTLVAGSKSTISWTVPNTLDNRPICKLGIAFSAEEDAFNGAIYLDHMKYSVTPQTIFRRPSQGSGDISGQVNMWHHSFVNSVDIFHTWGPSFFIAQDHGEGMISTGTREWQDYKIAAHKFTMNLGGPCGVVVRVRGLRRWYALMFVTGGRVSLVKKRDEERTELASTEFEWKLEEAYEVRVEVEDDKISAYVGDVRLVAKDSWYRSGGIGLLVRAGSLSCDSLEVGKIDSAG
jgi:ADP-ribosylglycohydrolase